eukprot:7333681-Prymnesium_polylepis.2
MVPKVRSEEGLERKAMRLPGKTVRVRTIASTADVVLAREEPHDNVVRGTALGVVSQELTLRCRDASEPWMENSLPRRNSGLGAAQGVTSVRALLIQVQTGET